MGTKITCPVCGGLWDAEILRQEADVRDATFAAVLAEFAATGCEALDTPHGR